MEENMNLKIKFYNNHFTKKIDNKKGMNIYNQNGQEYLIVERDYIYDLKLSDSLKDDYTSKVISDGNHQCSFIVDFNGIDNFIASKSLIFNDYDVRELVIKHLNLVEGKFKRFGASGSRPSEKHPGGEVVELQTIDVKNKTGCAGSVSGYLDMSNNEYSKAISLSEDGLTLREERTVYSHTIWIPENSKPIIVRLFIRDILGLTPIERQEELDIISALIQEMEKGNIVISAGNLYALPYSEIHYHVDNWPHLFIYKGYNYDTKMFRILDNIHMHTTKYKDLRYSDFFLSEDTVRKLYEEQGRVYDREFGFVVFNKNEYFGVKSDRQIVLTILRQLCMPKTGFKYRQIVKLISLNEALINGSIDNRQLKDLAKKILNINKYKTVMLNELSINMMENGYDTIYINRIKELADLLYAEWSDYVTVSVSKIKRKRFDSPEAVTESIEKMEDEIVSITKGYIDFLEKDEGTDRENKKISNEIIFVEEGKIIFSITDGKTHNFWFEDKAPKYPLLKNCNDDKIFAKARILFNQESEENLYQAGIYVKSAEDKVYYMAIDNDRNCILDTIGENNRKEEFDNTNEYLIKMNLEADCLKVQFISDASTKELKMMIERLAPVEVGLMVKTWGNGGFLEVDFKESQAIISNK